MESTIAAPYWQSLEAAQIRPQNGAISNASVVTMASHAVPRQRIVSAVFLIALITLRSGAAAVNPEPINTRGS
jgi:hypothetical protein